MGLRPPTAGSNHHNTEGESAMELTDKKDDYSVWTIDEDEASEIYAITQTSDELKMGDVFVIPSEGIIGVLIDAWPTAIIAPQEGDQKMDVDLHGLHTLNWESRDSSPEHPAITHEAQILTCCDIAESDADITGWTPTWPREATKVRELIG
jgi:hypothetical protein